MTKARMLWAGFACAVMVAGGCATSPPTHHYALTATAVAGVTPTGASPSIVIGAVTLPAEVDTEHLVVTVGANERRIEDLARWTGPLERNLGDVLALDLAADRGGARVIYRPGPTGETADFRVWVQVGRFESTPAREARIDAQWSVRRVADGSIRTGHSDAREVPADGSIAALVAAHSRAAATVAADIGAAIGSFTP